MTTGLKFYPASHRYKLDGQWVPGVTTLIGKGLPKPALVKWASKSVAEWVADNEAALEQMRHMGRGPLIAALKEVPWQARDTAAAKGTEIHKLGERLVHGEEVDVPEHLAGYVQGYVDWLDREQPDPLWTERPVANRQWAYAGTYDLIAQLRGETWMLDLKSAKGVYGDNAIQLAAYAGAEFMVTPEDEEAPLPHIDRLGVLHVQDGETTLYAVTDRDAAWKDWLHIQWVARAEERIRSYLYLDEPVGPLAGAA